MPFNKENPNSKPQTYILNPAHQLVLAHARRLTSSSIGRTLRLGGEGARVEDINLGLGRAYKDMDTYVHTHI